MKINDVYVLLPKRKVGWGNVEFENGLITSVEVDEISSSHLCNRSARLLLPGLINCHGHTAMTLVRGLGGGLPLQRWLEEAIFPVEAKMTAADIYAGARLGALEMLAGGTTLVADMYDFPSEGERAFADAGIRAHVCRVGLSFVPNRIDDCIAFAEANEARHLCVHSEYLTDESFCRALAAANSRLQRPVHFHCSETRKEHDECISRHGLTPMAYLASTGLLDYGGYAAHCVYCTDDDFRLMAERGISLVHNPTSNMKLGSGFARIRRAMELGVNVALGTDGCASNDNLDMFEEMHLASLIHKGIACDPTALSAWDVIEMATVNGASALGHHDLGEIAVGKAADFCIVDLHRPHLLPALDLPNLVVNSMHASDVLETWVAGRRVYASGQPIDARVERDFLSAVDRLFR